MVWERWTAPRSTDELTARQEQLVNILALGSAFSGVLYGLVLLALTLFTDGIISPLSFIGVGICLGTALITYYFSRRGWVRAAAILIVAGALSIGIYSVYMRGGFTVAAVVLMPAVVFAGFILGGRAGFLTSMISLAIYTGITLAQDQGWIPLSIENNTVSAVALTAVVFLIISLVTWQALRAMRDYIQRLEEREQVLESLSKEKGLLLEELHQREDVRDHLLATVRELGSVVIPLAEGVIAMPLAGAIDSQRARMISQALLQGVAKQQAQVVLVDITGVPLVDTAVASALIRAMAGVRLLGAEPVLTGIRAEVAQTIVELGLDLSGIVTQATLQEGLRYALAQLEAGQR